MNKTRTSFFPTEMLRTFPWMKPKIISVQKTGLTSTISNCDFILPNMMKLLFTLRKEPMHFSKLYINSGFRMKGPFCNYVRFCLELGLIKKLEKDKENLQIQPYGITEKGKQFLELLR